MRGGQNCSGRYKRFVKRDEERKKQKAKIMVTTVEKMKGKGKYRTPWSG